MVNIPQEVIDELKEQGKVIIAIDQSNPDRIYSISRTASLLSETTDIVTLASASATVLPLIARSASSLLEIAIRALVVAGLYFNWGLIGDFLEGKYGKEHSIKEMMKEIEDQKHLL